MELERKIAEIERWLLDRGLITEEQAEEFNKNWETIKKHLD